MNWTSPVGEHWSRTEHLEEATRLAAQTLPLPRLRLPLVCKAWSRGTNESTQIWRVVVLPASADFLDYFKVCSCLPFAHTV